MSPAREENLILCNAPLVGGSMEVTPEQVKTIVDATADAGFGGRRRRERKQPSSVCGLHRQRVADRLAKPYDALVAAAVQNRLIRAIKIRLGPLPAIELGEH